MKKILVVEDERSIRESLLELLTVEGFSVLGAANGRTGVQLAQQHLPDLILCDVTMPQLDGYQVLASLRQQAATAAIPFIFLTARGTKGDFRQGMEMGADDFLTKPCTADELLAAIASRFEKQATVLKQSQNQLDSLRHSIALSLPHELRTPLNGILGLSEVLIEDHTNLEPQEVLELAQGIHGSAERLSRLIQNFLLYAELEITARDSERLSALRSGETFFPSSLITHVASAIAQREGRVSDLQLDLQNTKIQISEPRLKVVVEELTDNAFKFSTAGTPVRLATVITSDGLTLTIADHGRGMTAEQLASLGAYMQFERKFYEQQGSGLGVAIAKRLVELHGGTLTIASVPGQQTTVQITLPGSEG
ncbi:hybrid sensor histidine kinase/response regulator [Stenomitos frigidus]|uniref:histidine kinase n=1 Tax=Stenomitos frigidus ULC18 TaxID=2107698 RepID=A0A2T1EGT9_9CYAN|nr:response regulator [Stenomitos frigidus]PSB31905.1 hybrid sensor histidine kinase/response regulator [Stenomitos frigidus ULC18]